jgi:glutamine amidotransferase
LIVILDYGCGNLRSVSNALKRLGANAEIQEDLDRATKLIIPGVGAFGAAMRRLDNLAPAIKSYVNHGGAVFGICLGIQLFFDSSEESPGVSGLGLMRGQVKRFPSEMGLKVPHIGWTQVDPVQGQGPLKGFEDFESFYFVHSYYVQPSDPSVVAATATYGLDFCAAVRKENIWGTQFHPEKSGETGMRVLENFVRWS